jgi:hypothetical protein
VSNNGAVAESVGAANTTKPFGQHSPDILWTGKHLVVGWEDESTMPRRVCTRAFNLDLTSSAGEICTPSGGAASRVALGSVQGDVVVSYRWDEDEETTFRVLLPSGAAFSTQPMLPPAHDENAVVAMLDDFTWLLVYVDGARVMRAALFDTSGVSLGGAVVLGSDRGRPSVVTTAAGTYLGWWEPAELPQDSVGWDVVIDELWFQRLQWDGSILDTTAEPIPLPRSNVRRLGDQALPSLTAVPYWPSGALVGVWTDLVRDGYAGYSSRADVVVELIPTPVVRNNGNI